MKAAKGFMLVLAVLAMALSVAPLIAVQPQNPDGPPPIEGGSGSGWRVTCYYDGFERLTGKVCNSGGNSSCACP